MLSHLHTVHGCRTVVASRCTQACSGSLCHTFGSKCEWTEQETHAGVMRDLCIHVVRHARQGQNAKGRSLSTIIEPPDGSPPHRACSSQGRLRRLANTCSLYLRPREPSTLTCLCVRRMQFETRLPGKWHSWWRRQKEQIKGLLSRRFGCKIHGGILPSSSHLAAAAFRDLIADPSFSRMRPALRISV